MIAAGVARRYTGPGGVFLEGAMMRWLRWAMVAAALPAMIAAAQAQDIKVAVAGPVTGPYAAFGEQMRRGGDLAVKDINAAGGVLGRKLSLTVADDACDPKQARTVANQLADAGVVFVDGHFCSGSSIPASAVYAENGMLEISPASTNPAFTDDAFAKGWNDIFRVCGRDDQQGKVAGDYLASHFRGRPIAIIDDKSTYGKGLADQTRDALRAAGAKEAMDESVNEGDKDFSALVSKMKQAGIAAYFYGGYHTEAGLLARQSKEQGLNAVQIGGDALATDEYWSITGPAGEGNLMTFPPDPRNLASAQKVVAEFRKQGYDPEGYTLFTYAAMQVFAAAADKAKSLKIDALSKVLHDNQFDTVLGRLGFNKKGDVIGPGYVVYIWHDGKRVELSHTASAK
jgi:branched-chain amino acid transport system substrate-binding protein